MRPRTREEDGSKIILFGVTLVQVVAKSKVKREVAGNLPVILNIRAVFQIPPVAEVARQVRTIGAGRVSRIHNARISPCQLFIRGINGKGKRIRKVVRGSRDVEFTILEVATQFVSHLHVVLAFGDRYHVRVRVDVFLKKLGISVVCSEAHFETVKCY